MRIVTADEMKRLDRYAIDTIGIPGAVLMESAGRSVYAEIRRWHPNVDGMHFAVLCGPGNNGGDGFVIARYLRQAHAHVTVGLVGGAEPQQGEACGNLKILRNVGVNVTKIETKKDLKKIPKDALIVDALFGTGLTRNVSGIFKDVVQFVNSLKAPVYSVDIPSGLHTDTGEILGVAIEATATITFACKKRGFFLNQGPEVCGDIVVADISIDDSWGERTGALPIFETTASEARRRIPLRNWNTHKGSAGHVLVFAGSFEKSGAAVLASKAALRAGAGLVTVAIPKSAHAVVKAQLTEVMSEPLPDDGEGNVGLNALPRLKELCEGKNALVIGPGLKLHKTLGAFLSKVVSETSLPIVLDADGLNALGKDIRKLKKHLDRVVLTPHPGEMSRLTGLSTKEIQGNRIDVARNYSADCKTTLVLKGAHSVVATVEGATYINPTGNPGMATAGMGDVLSGVIGAYLAQGMSPSDAAVAGVYNHGLAGDRVARKLGERGLTAGDVIEELPHLPI